MCEPNLKSIEGFDLVSIEAVLSQADVLVLLVDHRQFRKLTAADLAEKVVIDTRGVIQ